MGCGLCMGIVAVAAFAGAAIAVSIAYLAGKTKGDKDNQKAEK